MDYVKLLSALEETLILLRSSESSVYSHLSVEQVIGRLEAEVTKLQNLQPPALWDLSLLFAPTGAIQDTAIDNGWGDKFLKLAAVVDEFTRDP